MSLPCLYCGYTGMYPHVAHYWSCPNSPEMIAVRPKAAAIVDRFLARRAAMRPARMRNLNKSRRKNPPKLGPLNPFHAPLLTQHIGR